MGTVYRKTFTKPLPAGAEVVERGGVRLARWRDGAGKPRTARLTAGRDGAPRILVESGTYVAKYRDGSGIVVEEPTGCRTEAAARQVLADLERKAERTRAGLLSPPKPARPSTWRGRSKSMSPPTLRALRRGG
jgi:hypothetical protein